MTKLKIRIPLPVILPKIRQLTRQRIPQLTHRLIPLRILRLIHRLRVMTHRLTRQQTHRQRSRILLLQNCRSR